MVPVKESTQSFILEILAGLNFRPGHKHGKGFWARQTLLIFWTALPVLQSRFHDAPGLRLTHHLVGQLFSRCSKF